MSRPLEVVFDAGPVRATTTTADMTAATVRPTGSGR